MIIAQGAIDRLCMRATRALRSLTELPDGNHRVQVCIACDIMLDSNNMDKLPLDVLRKSKTRLHDKKQLPLPLKAYYTYKRDGYSSWMDKMLLSPKATYFKPERSVETTSRVCTATGSFSCCKLCKHSLQQQDAYKPPKFAIANGFAIGEAPLELFNLNDAELSLVSLNRNLSHIFSLYKPQHQSMRGFHTMFRSNVTHTRTAFASISKMTGKSKLACVLSGPFTKRQHQEATKSVEVNTDSIINAYDWLHINHVVYKDFNIPNETDIPAPIIIDDRYVVALLIATLCRKCFVGIVLLVLFTNHVSHLVILTAKLWIITVMKMMLALKKPWSFQMQMRLHL